MKIFLALVAFLTTFCGFSQEKLVFNARFVESEDKWVAFQPDSIGSYAYGFIYIDAQAGLTLNYEGTFTINKEGKFVANDKENENSLKVRLENNRVLVAPISDEGLKQLKADKVPDWLKIYKVGENTVERMYNWGYRYNGWNECAKALPYLEKAYKMNPEYKGLRVEMAFSFNCLKEYSKAISLLEVAVTKAPNDAYIYKELIYAQVNNNELDHAIATYEKVIKKLVDGRFNNENAYNILGAYYQQGNLKAFNALLEKTKLDKDKQLGPYVEQMKKELLAK